MSSGQRRARRRQRAKEGQAAVYIQAVVEDLGMNATSEQCEAALLTALGQIPPEAVAMTQALRAGIERLQTARAAG